MIGMQLDEAQRILRENRARLEELGVCRLRIFGSTARGEATSDSDVDVLVDFNRKVGLFHLVDVRDTLEELLGTEVDLVTRGALHPALAPNILAEAVDAA